MTTHLKSRYFSNKIIYTHGFVRSLRMVRLHLDILSTQLLKCPSQGSYTEILNTISCAVLIFSIRFVLTSNKELQQMHFVAVSRISHFLQEHL